MKTKTNQQPSFINALAALVMLMFLQGCLELKAQSNLFTENFESGGSAWTFLTNSGNGNNYWEISNGACSNGSSQLMVRRNTSPCVYRNNQAHNITAYAQVNATGYENLTLAFDWVCNGQANNDYGSVYYSLNGTNWTQLTTGGNSGMYQGSSTWQSQSAISLPATLEDKAFYLGFNWVNNNSGGSSPAFGFDNVVVQGTVKPVTPPTAPTTGIFSQNFSSGSLPSGWSNIDHTGNNAGTWSFNNPGGRTINTTSRANGFAIFDSDNIGQDNKYENASLISPAINCSDYAIVTLRLEHYFRYYLPSKYTIAISGDNGANYVVLEHDSAETANAETLNFDVSGYAAGKSQVRLKFTYEGSWGYYWAIDDIVMEGQMADSTVWTGAVSTAWNIAGNWSTNTVPSLATSVLIPANAVRMPTVGSGTGAGVNNLTIESGAILTVATDSTQGGNITITGTLTCDGSINHTGSALVKLSGVGQFIQGDFASGASDVSWELVSGASYTLGGNMRTFEMQVDAGATLSLNGFELSVYQLRQVGTLMLGSGTLEIAGNVAILTDGGFVPGTGTVNFNSGGSNWSHKAKVSQTIPSVGYYNLLANTSNGYTLTLGNGNSLLVSNDLILNNEGVAGGVVVTGAQITLQGNLVIGLGSHTGLTFNVGHRIATAGSSVLSFGGATANQINITYTDASLAAFSGFGGAIDFQSPVSFSGVGTQMVFPATYQDLAIAGSGTKALGGDVQVGGNLSLNSGTLSTTVSMLSELATTDADVAVNFLNGGLATNNTAPTLASLMASASSKTITIPAGYGNFRISAMQITIPHTYNADLDIYLSSPSGTVYTISTDNGGSGDGYLAATFTDWGTTTYPNNAVLNGTYRPEGVTFGSILTPINGTWTLWVIDDAIGDDGTITDFKLQLQSATAFGNIALTGNWINNGGTFTAGNGRVTFAGNATQAVTSDGQNFYDLTINNTAGVTLNDNLTVTNGLALTSGVVSTGANRLILTSTTSGNLSGFSTNSFVNGNLRRYIGYNTQNYAFPVGNGISSTNYRLAEMQNNLLLGVSYIDAHFQSLSNHLDAELNVTENGMDVARIHPAGTWVIEPNSQPILGSYDIKLSITGFTGLVDNEFVVLKRQVGSTTGADWSTGGGLLSLLNGLGRLLSDGFALRTGLTSFSEFGIGDGGNGGSSLPIELVAFTAKANSEGTVNLAWTTAIEIENEYFEVEHSVDGKQFSVIAKVAGAGNSTLERSYQAVDSHPEEGINYYRLKQVDFDRTFTYSPIKSVVFAREMTKTEYVVYPNPSNGQFTVEVSALGSTANFYVVDMQGRVLYHTTWDAQEGSLHQSLDLTDILHPGIYKIVMVQGNSATSKTIVVQ